MTTPNIASEHPLAGVPGGQVSTESAIVDARGSMRLGLPLGQRTPVILRSVRELPSEPPNPVARTIAGMPVVDPDTRTTIRPIVLYVVIDVSASNQTTDPADARFQDVAFLCHEFLPEVLPDDQVVLVLFDTAAQLYPPCRPAAVPADGGRSLPIPGNGGTAFVPPITAVVRHAGDHPDRAHIVVLITDGMGDDVFEANALLVDAGIPAVLIPYGPDFPFVSAQYGWELSEFTIAKHVNDVPLTIAQTCAIAVTQFAGMRRGVPRSPAARA
jgi:hypothetical protein